MRSGGIKNDAIRGYLPGLIQRYESLGDSRIPLARFIERDLPQHFPEGIAGDVVTKLRGFGRERHASTGPKDSSRYTVQDTVKSLRGSQQDHLTEVIRSNTYRKDLIDAEDKIKADMRKNAEAGYETALANGLDRFTQNRAAPDEVAAFEQMRTLIASEPFLSRVPDHVKVRAIREGKPLEEAIAADPVRTAHWLQSALGKAERAAQGMGGKATPESLLYSELREAVLDPLQKAVPGYKGARSAHGDLFGADEALEFGEDLFLAARSEVETARKARDFGKLSKQQQTVATMSIRDKLLNEFRGTPEDAAAKLTRMQQEGVLDAIERILGADGKRITAAIRETVEENDWLRSIDQGSGSPTFANAAGARDAAENVRGPINKAVGSLGDKRTYLGAVVGDVVLSSVGVPPVLTVGKATSDVVGAAGRPSARQLSNASKGLFGLPEPKAPAPPPTRAPRGPRKPKAPEQLEADLETLLKRYDEIDHRNNPTESARVLKQIDALKKRLAKPPATTAPSRPPEQAGFVTPSALAPLVGGSGGLAYGEFAPLQDMDRDGDTDADDRQAMRMSYGLGGLVGGGLAGAGANRLLGPRRGAPKAGPQKPPAQAPQAKAAPAVGPDTVSQTRIGNNRDVAEIAMPDGGAFKVKAEVFPDRDAVVMSPTWPTNDMDDLVGALKHQQSTMRARARGMDVVNDPPQSQNWAQQNPQEWAQAQQQIGDSFVRLVRSTMKPAHVLALADDVDINGLATRIQLQLPPGRVVMVSPSNGELAVVSKQYLGEKPEQFARWKTYNAIYNQNSGLLPMPPAWATDGLDAPMRPTTPKPPVQSGFGGAPTKGRSGTASRMIAGGVVGGMAGSLAGDAQAQSTETATQLDAVNERIKQLEADAKIFETGSILQIQQLLQRRGKVIADDGKMGPQTAAAIQKDRDETRAELEAARKRRSDLEKQAATEATRPNEAQMALREWGPILGALAGLGLGTKLRSGAVNKAAKSAPAQIAKANALLTPGPLNKSRNAAAQAALKKQPANLNEFWQLGGAKDAVPFDVGAGGKWKPRKKSDVMPPSKLYPNRRIRSMDVGVMAGGVAEGVGAQFAASALEGQIEEARALAEKEPTRANLARVEALEDQHAIAVLMSRLGYGVAGGRLIASLKIPYKDARPDVAAADAERALLLEYLKKVK